MSSLSNFYVTAARLVFVIAVVGMAATATAAETGHTVRGVVRNPSGAEVSRAEVQVRGSGPSVVGVARTDDRGRFVVTVPRSGTYVLVVRTAGFADTPESIKGPGGEGGGLGLTTGV